MSLWFITVSDIKTPFIQDCLSSAIKLIRLVVNKSLIKLHLRVLFYLVFHSCVVVLSLTSESSFIGTKGCMTPTVV